MISLDYFLSISFPHLPLGLYSCYTVYTVYTVNPVLSGPSFVSAIIYGSANKIRIGAFQG